MLVLASPFLYGARDSAYLRCVLDIGGCQLTQPLKLLNHGRNDEPKHTANDGHHKEQTDEDAEYAPRHMQSVLHELHQGIEQVGQQPRNGKGQQHAAEIVDEQQHKNHDSHIAQDADKAIKGNDLV